MTLDDWSVKLFEALERSLSVRSNETELREDAEVVLRAALSELYGFSDLSVTAERDSSGGTGARRPYDKLYGGMVIEWEWKINTAARREHAAHQALEYLENLTRRGDKQSTFSAAVSDGKEWGFLVQHVNAKQLDLFGFTPVSDAEHFEWVPNSENACRRFLELIGANRKRPITAKEIAAAFGPRGNHNRLVLLFIEALTRRQPMDRTDTLYLEWRRVIDVVYGAGSSTPATAVRDLAKLYNVGAQCELTELLFATHTYLSVIAKLFAAELLARVAHAPLSQPTCWIAFDRDQLVSKLRDLNEGTILAGTGLVENLLEPDHFSWWLDDIAGNIALIDGVRDAIGTLDELSFPPLIYGSAPSHDVLRDLYHELIPRTLRRALGEFLTPTWLAEACLERMLSVGADVIDGRVLDPTCGTGTFLVPVLRARVQRLRSAGAVSHASVVALLDGIAGFDINPIAVIAARVNFVLALGDLTNVGSLTLPIWRADSINVPQEPAVQTDALVPSLIGRAWREFRTILPDAFPVPTQLATSNGLARLREAIETAIVEQDDNVALAEFNYRLESTFGEQGTLFESPAAWDNIASVGRVLYERIRILHNQGKDGVWARIIENAFAPTLVGRFNVIVGNPPWISWTRLPREWRATTEPSWRKYGLWNIPSEPGKRTRSHATSDIATLVYATAIDEYAAPSAFVGLLTPKALVTADPGGRAFRQFRLQPDLKGKTAELKCDVSFAPKYCDDWSVIKPFAPDAANTPIFLICRRGETAQYPVPVSKWSRRRPLSHGVQGDWHERRLRFEEALFYAWPVSRDFKLSAWDFTSRTEGSSVLAGGTNRYTFGKGLDTRGANGIYFVEAPSHQRNGRVIIANLPDAGRDARVLRRPRDVDVRLVYPLLRGRDVRPWLARATTYIMAPYSDAGHGQLLSESELRSYHGAYEFLNQFRVTLSGRRPPPRRNWNLAGADWYRLDGPMEHMFEPFKVVVRELENGPSAALVRDRFDEKLQRTAPVLIDHKLCYCSMTTEAEALFVVGMLNAPPVQALLKRFGNSIAISPQTLARLPIPDYDAVIHAPLVTVVRSLMEKIERNQNFDVDRQQAADIADTILIGGTSSGAAS